MVLVVDFHCVIFKLFMNKIHPTDLTNKLKLCNLFLLAVYQ